MRRLSTRSGGSGRPGWGGFGTIFPKGMTIRAGPGLERGGVIMFPKGTTIRVGPGLERPLDTWPLGLSVHGHL